MTFYKKNFTLFPAFTPVPTVLAKEVSAPWTSNPLFLLMNVDTWVNGPGRSQLTSKIPVSCICGKVVEPGKTELQPQTPFVSL